MEDAFIEMDDATTDSATYLCSVPVDKEYQMEQKIVFIESNIVKNTLIGNSSGRILKTIVTKNLGEYRPLLHFRGCLGTHGTCTVVNPDNLGSPWSC